MIPAAQAALRDRQGKGARYDDPSAPHEDLLLARRGISYLARHLNGLQDDAVTGNAETITQVSYTARNLAESIEAARRGSGPGDCTRGMKDRMRNGTSLPPRAIRSLYAHATQHLSIEWRDLDANDWASGIATMGQDQMPMYQTPRAMARLFYSAGLSLGGRPQDTPPELR